MLAQDCLLCGGSAADLLCARCEADLPRLPAPLCPICALPAPAAQPCGACQARPPHFDATIAAFRYGFPLDRLVQALKYRHQLALASWLAAALLAGPRPAADIDIVMAVPLGPRRLAQRGFNQAGEIARPLARGLGLRLDLNAGARPTDTAAQADLPWRARQANVHGAFAVGRDLGGASVIVVDDVMTTGATLNEFARALKQRGAARVVNWVVARALRSP